MNGKKIFDEREKNFLLIEHLTKIYGKRVVALNDLNGEIKLGQIYGILGPNGAGKSTLIKMIGNIERPTTGTIKLDGIDITHNLQWAKENVGYCPQNPVFYSYLTVKENIRLIADLFNLQHSVSERIIDQLLITLNLQDKENELANTLSGGQKKRLSLILSLIHRPRILLLDEPTAGLDVLSSRLILDYIMNLREMGLTILLTTHDFTNIETLCDQVLLLNMGKLVARGAPKNIINEWVKDKLIIECACTEGSDILSQITRNSSEIEVIDSENYCREMANIRLSVPGNFARASEIHKQLQESGKFSQVMIRKPTLLDAYLIVIHKKINLNTIPVKVGRTNGRKTTN